MLAATLTASIEAHREQLLSLARRRGVTDVRVFGSMDRSGERRDSDVDLLVTLAPGTSALALGGLLLDAQELLGRRVERRIREYTAGERSRFEVSRLVQDAVIRNLQALTGIEPTPVGRHQGHRIRPLMCSFERGHRHSAGHHQP